MNTREQFGSYLLLKKLTEDPLGETFRAGKVGKQGMERVVLVRVFNGQGLDGERLWQRSKDRGPIQQALKSPNLGDGVDFGQVRGIPYVAYDYVSGKNLATLLEQAERKRAPIPADHAMLIAERVALGLAVAHEGRFGDERILHGFLVPHLVMLSNEGETRLLGFEVSPALREVAVSAAAREHFSRYLAPEVLAGQAIAKNDDVYSLGSLLFELLTGKRLPPPVASGYGAVVDQATVHGEGTPLPAEIGNLLKRSLAPREQRHTDAVVWHKSLSKLMFEGHYNPTTFNLAFFMHNLFREEIDRETQEIAAEKTIEVPTPAAPAAAPPPPAPAVPVRTSLREETGVREDTATVRARYGLEEKRRASNKGLLVGGGVTVLAVLGVAGYFLLFRDAAPPPADPPPVEAAAPAPVVPAEPPPPPVPAGPTPEEIQTQIDRMIDERVKAMEAATRKQFDEQLKSLASQLDEARRLAAERAAAPPRPAEPVASPPPPAPAPTAGTAETAAGPPAATQPGATSTGTPAVPIPSTGSAAPAPTGTAPPTTRPAGTSAQPPTTPPATQPATGTPATQSPSGAPATSPEAGTPTTGAAAPPPAARPPEVKVGDLVELGPGVIPPRRTGNLQANYPAQARRLNRTAVVRVSVLVDESGRVVQAALKEPRRAGFGFDEEALAAARGATFQPGTKNGVRVKMWYDLSINFTP